MRQIIFLTVFVILSSTNAESDSPNTNTSIPKFFQERQRLEGLLAAGRKLAFPLNAGWTLAVISSLRENWNISLHGLNHILELPEDQLAPTYKDTVKLMKQEVSGKLFAFQPLKNVSATTLEALIEIEAEEVKWDKDKSNATWKAMNDYVNSKTGSLLDGKLIPKDTIVGNPFRFSTQGIFLSTFHHKSNWKVSPKSGSVGQFGTGENASFIEHQGQLQVSEAEDYLAVKIPLEMENRSLVFVKPKVNLTQYLKSFWKSEDDRDVVPFPRNWERRAASIHIPIFNVTVTTDQYGKELEELGMNQTFCTTLVDRRGKFPFYLRPIVQVNTVSLTGTSIEIASATGIAIEKFYFGLDLIGAGYPKSKSIKTKADQKNPSTIFKQDNFRLEQNSEEETTTSLNEETEEKFVLDKPFLWYLNDDYLGPLFYGIVETVSNKETSLEDSSEFTEETLRYLSWSCRSFKQDANIDEGVTQSQSHQ